MAQRLREGGIDAAGVDVLEISFHDEPELLLELLAQPGGAARIASPSAWNGSRSRSVTMGAMVGATAVIGVPGELRA